MNSTYVATSSVVDHKITRTDHSGGQFKRRAVIQDQNTQMPSAPESFSEDSLQVPLTKLDLLVKLCSGGANDSWKSRAKLMHKLIECGQEDAIKDRFQKAQIDVNALDEDGFTMLYGAASRGYQDVVSLLLALGAFVDQRGKDGNTALQGCIGCYNEEPEIAKLLIIHGASTQSEDIDGGTPLSDALHFGSDAMLRLLLENGADIYQDLRGQWNIPLLKLASEGKRFATVVRILCEHNVDVNASDSEGRCMLSYAAAEDDVETLKLLIKHGAILNARDKKGQNALHYAVQRGSVNTSEILVKKKVPINAVDNEGCTPLHRAVLLKDDPQGLMYHLLESGADVKAKNKAGHTPLHIARDLYLTTNTDEYYQKMDGLLEHWIKVSSIRRAIHEAPWTVEGLRNAEHFRSRDLLYAVKVLFSENASQVDLKAQYEAWPRLPYRDSKELKRRQAHGQ